jgi:hypothetical protein
MHASNGVIREMPVSRRHLVLDPLEKCALGSRAGGPGDLTPFLDKDEARDALNGKAGSEFLLNFRVNLAETQVWLELGRNRREAWGHLAARPAPSRPEVDQKRNVA